jgi:predicted NUDIX family NTP pyrophosphohydrolase
MIFNNAMTESAGLLMFRKTEKQTEVFLVHPGGPYWEKQDKWGIPKGWIEAGEDQLQAGIREFEEETGIKVQTTDFKYLGAAKSSTKLIHAWAFEFDFNGVIKSNEAEIEFPAKSGKIIKILEVDKGQYFSIEDARNKIHRSQLPLLESFVKLIN